MQLDPVAAKAGVRLIVRDELDSTNAEALRLARTGEEGPLWIVARQQTAGRGRRDNSWVSEPGNLYATLLIGDPSQLRIMAELSFVAALAVLGAVESVAPSLRHQLALKWPNDVLAGGRKLAGILIESEGSSAAIGFGINCISHPDTAFPATDIAQAGVTVTAEELFAALSASMLSELRRWNRGAGFTAVRTAWLERAAGIGSEIRVRLPDRELHGVFQGLDGNGRLLLERSGGLTETITAGEVFGLPPPAGR
jgi:BirA family biotin operon repressor/biotin-[acetyl-CoA-carboxylase] ligase